MSRAVLLGRVTSGDGRTAAALFADGTWRVIVDGVDVPELAAALGAVYRGEYEGPQYGPPGARALSERARRSGGVATYLGPYRGPDPGVVY